MVCSISVLISELQSKQYSALAYQPIPKAYFGVRFDYIRV